MNEIYWIKDINEGKKERMTRPNQTKMRDELIYI